MNKYLARSLVVSGCASVLAGGLLAYNGLTTSIPVSDEFASYRVDESQLHEVQWDLNKPRKYSLRDFANPQSNLAAYARLELEEQRLLTKIASDYPSSIAQQKQAYTEEATRNGSKLVGGIMLLLLGCIGGAVGTIEVVEQEARKRSKL